LRQGGGAQKHGAGLVGLALATAHAAVDYLAKRLATAHAAVDHRR
jgi:hypothetical protein